MGFQQGLSGLNATSKSLDVIGNNIANANTYGAKVARAEFADMYATALNGAGTNNVGIGTNIAAVAQQFTQGNITTTGNAMDLAVNGAGFFQLQDGSGPPVYSRNGQFKIDRDGYIVNNAGLKLLGYPAAEGGKLETAIGMLKLPTKGIDAFATTEVKMEFNVDASAKAPTKAFDVDSGDSYNNATSVVVYDSLGKEIPVTFYFRKTGENAWDVHTKVGSNAATNWLGLTFNPTTGKLATMTPAADPPTLTVSGQSIKVPIPEATQFASSFGVTNLAQDGYTAGDLTSIGVEANGNILARYSNGKSMSAGQLVLANFRNPQGLQPLGGNVWARTFASGDVVQNNPGDGGLGVMQSGALEDSNIDLTGELVNMITAQRIYQANAQTIKTQDQVMQTLVNLR